MKRQEFMKHAHLDNTWNRIHSFEYNGKEYNIGTVLWHSNAWKHVSTKDFDKIKDRGDKTNIIFECYSQADLWNYFKENIFNNN